MLMCLAVPVQTIATPITRQQAQLNVLTFMQERGKDIAVASLHHAPMRDSQADEPQPYYVFNIGNHQGYVIASGDDAAHALLGYSDEGFIDVNDIPCNLQAWLDDYAHQIKYLQDHGATASLTPKKTSYPPAISPMLTCQWSQGYPFNMFCPIDPITGQRCLTGCVATAMAQVMYFHRDHSVNQTLFEIPAYTIGGMQIDAIPAGSVIDWDNMIDDYLYSNPTESQKAAVANLMKYCGVAFHMDYHSDRSGASIFLALKALKEYFVYFQAHEIRRDYSEYSDEEWNDIIYNELAENRPVLYSGYPQDSIRGHAFVCDGYDGNGYYHINWGWFGYLDGYFVLDVSDCEDCLLDFAYNQDVLIGLQPKSINLDLGMHFVDPRAKYECLMRWDEDNNGVFTMNEARAVKKMDNFEFYESDIESFDEFQYFTGLNSIADYAFTGCSKLKSITIPNSVHSIGLVAFWGCSNLTNMTIGNAVGSIGADAFTECNIKNLIWKTELCNPGGAFSGSTVENLTIGNGVKTIYQQFLKTDALPRWVQSLRKVMISNTVTTIGRNAFRGFEGIKDLIIGRGVTAIDNGAFEYCIHLSTVTCLAPNPPQLNNQDVFGSYDGVPGPYEKATLRVPIASVATYKSTYPWSLFKNIVGLDPSSGDVNCDGEVNLADINCIINNIMGVVTDNLSYYLSDVNCDGGVGIADINALIDIILDSH